MYFGNDVLPVDGWPITRIKHARKRYRELEVMVAEIRAMDVIRADPLRALAGEYFELRVAHLDQPDLTEVSLLVGEICHALVGALDSMLWQILRRYHPDFVAIERNILFPVVEDGTYWRQRTKNYWQGVPEFVKARVVACQPAYSSSFDDPHPLIVLKSINNRDKHKEAVRSDIFVMPHGLATFMAQPDIALPFKSAIERDIEQRLQTELELETVFLKGVVPKGIPKVEFNPSFRVDFMLDVPEVSKPVPLHQLGDLVDIVWNMVQFLRTGREGFGSRFRLNPEDIVASGLVSGIAFARR